MCGICGVFNYAGTRSEIDPELIKSMSDQMKHRGPDDEGIFLDTERKVGIGIRRLSIIDLAGGHQPMANEDETVWIVLNGEIYNHQDLRKYLEAKGHIFKTRSDTETIVHLYEEKGIDCLSYLRGMFAFAIWDAQKNRLFLARDRLGVKPLYYAIKDGSIIFGSEIKAILKYPGIQRDMNSTALYHYLTFLATPAPDTLFQGIAKLEPGFLVTVEEGGSIHKEQYWNVLDSVTNSPKKPDGYYVERLRELLSEAISLRMMSDVPLGVFLSGGLDSSANVALMDSLMEGPVSTFTVGFKGYEKHSELDYARQISRQFNTNHHEVIIDHKDMLDCLPGLIYHQDEPIADPVCVPLYFLAKLARDSGVAVIQMGEGADELFGGYEHYLSVLSVYRKWSQFARLPGIIKKGAYHLSYPILERMGQRWHQRSDYVRRAAYGEELYWGGGGNFGFHEPEKQALLGEELKRILGGTTSHDVIGSYYREMEKKGPDLDIMQKFAYIEMKIRLAELLLMRVDKMTMSNSVEARVPYLDHKLVEFAMNLPTDLKIRGSQLKYLMKQAARNLVPENIIHRNKVGFMVPVKEWFTLELSEYVSTTLLQSGLVERGLFDKEFIEKLIAKHQAGKGDYSHQLWPLFNLALWHRYWIEGRELQ